MSGLVAISIAVVEMFLVFYVCYDAINRTCDFIGGRPTRRVTNLPSLVTLCLVVVEVLCI